MSRGTYGLSFSTTGVALCGLGLLPTLVGGALDLVWPLWLVVLDVVFTAAGAAAAVGKHQLKAVAPPVPHHAMADVQADVQTVETAAKEGRRLMSTSDTPTDPEQLRVEIAETRVELGATVEALAAKVDVKTRAKHAVTDAVGRARQKLSTTWGQMMQAVAVKTRAVALWQYPQVQRTLTPVALAAGAAAVTVAVLVVVGRRRK